MAFVSTTTPLAAGATYSTGTLVGSATGTVRGSVFSDQPGTIYVEQSGDGTNWDISTDYPVAANDGKGFDEPVYFGYVRVRYVNGATAQGSFRLFVRAP